MPMRFGGVGVALPLNQIGTNGFTLQAGEVFYIPSGYFNLRHGPNSTVQTKDPVMGIWRPIGADGTNWVQVDSDGNNYRIANQTGCPVAAILSNAGTLYTSAPTVVVAAGGSKWVAVMGQVISTVITVAAGGANYVYPPALVIQAPPAGGIPATATSVLTGGAVTSAVVVNQGGGYASPPPISVVNDPRDTTGAGAILTSALTGAQTVNGVLCVDHGLPITSGTVPALTFTGGGGSAAAATIVMDWTVTSYAVTAGGLGFVGGVQVSVAGNGVPTIAPVYLNPDSQTALFRSRAPLLSAAISSAALTATGQTLVDGGHLGSIPVGTVNANNTAILITGGGFATIGATLTLGFGGASDPLWIQQG